MFLSALRPPMFFGALRRVFCSSSRLKLVTALPKGPRRFFLNYPDASDLQVDFFPSHESRVFDYSGYQSGEDLKKLYVCSAPIELATKPFQSDETDGHLPRENRNDDK